MGMDEPIKNHWPDSRVSFGETGSAPLIYFRCLLSPSEGIGIAVFREIFLVPDPERENIQRSFLDPQDGKN